MITASIYAFMALATTLAVLGSQDRVTKSSAIAAAVVGLTWPLFIATKIIQRIL